MLFKISNKTDIHENQAVFFQKMSKFNLSFTFMIFMIFFRFRICWKLGKSILWFSMEFHGETCLLLMPTVWRWISKIFYFKNLILKWRPNNSSLKQFRKVKLEKFRFFCEEFLKWMPNLRVWISKVVFSWWRLKFDLLCSIWYQRVSLNCLESWRQVGFYMR